LQHFWNPASQGVPMTLCDVPLPLQDVQGFCSHCFWLKGALREEGLLQSGHPHALCVGPSVFYPPVDAVHRAVRHWLTYSEILRIYDLSLVLDPILRKNQLQLIAALLPLSLPYHQPYGLVIFVPSGVMKGASLCHNDPS
jgi:hypothetical protein